jgi:hypothetical protein
MNASSGYLATRFSRWKFNAMLRLNALIDEIEVTKEQKESAVSFLLQW